MRRGEKNMRYPFITAISVCFFLCAAILPIEVCYSGEIIGWGIQKTHSTPLTNFTKIAAGYYHSLALKSDGSIVDLGDNWTNQMPVPPPAGNDFVAVAAGGYHSLAIKSDRSIVCWGYDAFGLAGNNFRAVAAGGYHSLALKTDGTIVGWGHNTWGQGNTSSGL